MQGYKMATGDIIGLVMADDWLEGDALQTLAALYQKKPDAEMFCFGMQEYKLEPSGERVKTKSFTDPEGEVFTLLDGLYCQGVNRYYSRKLLQEEGIYRDEIYPNLADRDFYVRLGIRQTRKAWTDKILYNFLTHPGSNSTGGSAQKVIIFLDETARMAADYLNHSGIITKHDKNLLKDWYCFNMIRSIAFRVKARRIDAISEAIALGLRYPLCTLRNLVNWKMPEPYRARVSL
jgi:glycosyltransferase involved in cell wall biosynthesis